MDWLMATKRIPLHRARRWAVSPAAVARWREVRPWGLHRAADPAGAYIIDEQLGTLLGVPMLLAMPAKEVDTLYLALEEAVR